MPRISRVRRALITVGVSSLVLISTTVAGAAPKVAVYNATDAAMVPLVYRGVPLTVASDAIYAPDEFMRGSRMVGFDISLMKAIGTTLGLRIKEKQVTFGRIIVGIKSGQYQIGNSSFTDTKAIEKQVNFIDYFNGGQIVYAKRTSRLTFKNLANLCGRKVTVKSNSPEGGSLSSAQKLCPARRKMMIETLATQKAMRVAVLSGRVFAAFLDSQIAGYVVSTSKGRLKLVGRPINVVPFGMATARSSDGQDLAMVIQMALKTLISKGVYQAILKQWGVSTGAVTAHGIVLNGATS